jgi:hypothetical protein
MHQASQTQWVPARPRQMTFSGIPGRSESLHRISLSRRKPGAVSDVVVSCLLRTRKPRIIFTGKNEYAVQRGSKTASKAAFFGSHCPKM